jgi:hypothetical protein
MIEILYLLAAIITIIGGFLGFTKWGRTQCRKFLHFFTRYRPKVPKETIRIIPRHNHNWWYLGSSKNKPAMQLFCDLYITNISDVDVLICEVILKKPKTVGHIFVRHPDQDIYGSYSIPPGYTTKANADFWIQPLISKSDKQLISDIEFVDQFGNSHRVKKVQFYPKLKKKQEQISPQIQMERISDIKNPVEKKVVSVLQAEINRYKDCGRKVGGLGSIKTTYRKRTYCGFGTDWRVPDSPELQEVISDPENVKIESDNATILINLYCSFNEKEQNDFVENLLKRISRQKAYAPIAYFILFVLYRIGYLNKALETAQKTLQGDSAYGFSDFLRLLDGLLKYEYQKFSTEMLDSVEQFLKEIKEPTFKIYERLSAIRALSLAGRLEKEKK